MDVFFSPSTLFAFSVINLRQVENHSHCCQSKQIAPSRLLWLFLPFSPTTITVFISPPKADWEKTLYLFIFMRLHSEVFVLLSNALFIYSSDQGHLEYMVAHFPSIQPSSHPSITCLKSEGGGNRLSRVFQTSFFHAKTLELLQEDEYKQTK